MVRRCQPCLALPVIAVCGLTASACEGSSAADSASASSAPLSSTTTAAPPALALGTTYTARDGSVTLAVQRVTPKVREIEVSEGMPPQVGGALVRACIKSGDGKLSWDSWTAMDPAGLQFSHFGPVSDLPGPFLPSVISDPLKPGTCVTGWVDFEMVRDGIIAKVIYTHDSEIAAWSAS